MVRFVLKILLYLVFLLLMVSLYLLVVFFRPDYVDYFYYKFTTPRSNSLILGASRAAQGIKPSVLNKYLTNTENRIINHAFAGGPSSLGPNYLRELQQKLNKDSRDGLFIISVTPWGFTEPLANVNDDSTQFFEVRTKLFVGNLKSSSSNPNFEYLWRYWNNKFSVLETAFKYLIHYEGILRLHADGWLEVNIDMSPEAVKARVDRSTREYVETSRNIKWSPMRVYFIEKIIDYLKPRGEIYLVRLPVSADMAAIERMSFPQFDNFIREMAAKHGLDYTNFIDESGNYRTTDTHHLWREEAEKISHQLSDSILLYRKQKQMMLAN